MKKKENEERRERWEEIRRGRRKEGRKEGRKERWMDEEKKERNGSLTDLI